MHHFVIAPRHVGRTGRALTHAPLAPADYLKMRRTAANVSRRDLARALVMLEDHRRPLAKRRPTAREIEARIAETIGLVALLETPGARARDRETIAAIAAVLPIDPDVYHQLATEPADRHPRICRGCGCSGHDACVDDESVCRWVGEHLCSRCAERDAAEQEAA